jgi:crotonobetainyl-CoA:carnitine CoA-transferase CaiB-like acyl-CoA transferase
MTTAPVQALTGVRVLDLTQVWAGPLCVQQLADFGAEVIKIDSRSRGAEAMAAAARRRGGQENGNGALKYASMLRNRHPLTLDLGHPAGRDLLKQLAAKSDVLVENYSARVMSGWGIGPRDLAAINPRLIYLSLAPSGHSGPWSGVTSYGPSLNALYGAKSFLGYPGDPMPMEDMSEADPIGGMYGFHAVLGALLAREQNGVGGHLDLAQGEALVAHAVEGVVAAQVDAPVARGNRHPTMAPHGLFRCAGEDEWVSIAVETDEEWRALCGLMEAPELCPRYPDAAARLAGVETVEAAVERWTSARDKFEVWQRCRERGIAALPLLHNFEQVEDQHLRARRQMGIVAPAEIGGPAAVPYSEPVKLSKTPAVVWGPERTFDVPHVGPLRDVLGLSDGEIERLIEEGIV